VHWLPRQPHQHGRLRSRGTAARSGSALPPSKRRAIDFLQLLVEAGVIGLAGGALGLGLAWLGLWAVRHQPTPYADLAQLDLPMLAATFGLAVAASLFAGLLPAWRGCQVAPAIQLKSH
jgi:putative ABC transport system permease protein